MNKLLKRIGLSMATLVFSASTLAAGMQDQLDGIFDGMANYTAPGAFETQRRMGFSAGRFTYKVDVWDQNLVSLRLPSAKGSCNGIDIFGGSFSMVSADELVNLFRQVAAAAPGYAFQIALDQMCPGCSKWMNELQAKIQQMNDRLGNSCDLAQGLVTDIANTLPLDRKYANDKSLVGTFSGLTDDFLEVTHHVSTVGNVFEEAEAAGGTAQTDINEADAGNIVYNALMAQNASSWFPSGDSTLVVQIMSITGSFVIGELETASDGGKRPKLTPLTGQKIKLRDLIEGTQNAVVYDCTQTTIANKCAIEEGDTTTVAITGLEQKLKATLTGTDGIITAMRNKTLNPAISDEQKAVLTAMPNSIVAKIYGLSHSPDAAEALVDQSSKAMSLVMVYKMTQRAFRAAERAMSADENAYKSKALEQMQASKEALTAEYEALAQEYGNLREIEEHYRLLVQNVVKPSLIPTNASY